MLLRRLMVTPRESRDALELVTGEALAVSSDLASRVRGTAEVRRAALLEGVPEVIGYYSLGSAALAADFYEEQRELAAVRTLYAVEPVVTDRTVKIRRGVAWASDPFFDGALDDVAALTLVGSRLAEVVQLETARPFRDTITTNRRRDPAAVGWRRITRGGCPFCRMLADKGAIYKQETALFAAHPSCHCTAQPVFTTTDTGVEASVMQYKASAKNRTAKQKAELRDYLNTYY